MMPAPAVWPLTLPSSALIVPSFSTIGARGAAEIDTHRDAGAGRVADADHHAAFDIDGVGGRLGDVDALRVIGAVVDEEGHPSLLRR